MTFKDKFSYHNFLLISSLLLFLFPAAQISGPLFTDLFLIIMSCIFLFIYKHDKQFYLFKSDYFRLFIVFWIYIVIRSLISDSFILSIKSTLPYFRFCIFSMAVCYVLKNSKNCAKYFYISIFVTLSILIFDGYFQFLTGKNIFGFSQPRPDRLGGLFFEELILGSYIEKILPIFITLFAINKNTINKNYILLFISLAYLLVFLSGERSSFILLSFYFVLIAPFFIRLKTFLSICLIAITIFSTLVLTNKNLKSRWIEQMQMHTVGQNAKYTVFMPDHIGLFTSAIDIFQKNIFFGSGVKTFRVNCKYTDQIKIIELKNLLKQPVHFCSTHPHNYYLQLLAETGIFGFLLVFVIFLRILYIYFKQLYFLIKKNNKLKSRSYISILSGLLVTIWPLTTTGSLFNNWISSTIFLTVGIYFFVSFNEKNNL